MNRGAHTAILAKNNNFGYLLRSLRQREGLSSEQLGKNSLISGSYIRRMELGQRRGCSRPIVMALARGLNLDHKETNNLLIATGHSPDTIGPKVQITATILAVASIEADPAMTTEARQAFEQVIINICNHWRPLPSVN